MIKPPILEHITTAILNQILIDRDGYAINRSAVKSCVDVLLRLRYENDGATVYQRHIEPGILKESKSFYTEEGTKLVETCDAPEFLRRVRALLMHSSLYLKCNIGGRTTKPRRTTCYSLSFYVNSSTSS